MRMILIGIGIFAFALYSLPSSTDKSKIIMTKEEENAERLKIIAKYSTESIVENKVKPIQKEKTEALKVITEPITKDSVKPVNKNGKLYTVVDAVGCKDKSGLTDATGAIIRGGFEAFLPYVKSHGCLFLRNGSEVTKLKTKMPDIQILYHNPFGSNRILWVGYDTI